MNDKDGKNDSGEGGSEDEEFGEEPSSESENENGNESEEDVPISSSFNAEVNDGTNVVDAEKEDRRRKKTTKEQKNVESEIVEDKAGFTFDDADTSDEEVGDIRGLSC